MIVYYVKPSKWTTCVQYIDEGPRFTPVAAWERRVSAIQLLFACEKAYTALTRDIESEREREKESGCRVGGNHCLAFKLHSRAMHATIGYS